MSVQLSICPLYIPRHFAGNMLNLFIQPALSTLFGISSTLKTQAPQNVHDQAIRSCYAHHGSRGSFLPVSW